VKEELLLKIEEKCRELREWAINQFSEVNRAIEELKVEV
jgi:hypothetical protein